VLVITELGAGDPSAVKYFYLEGQHLVPFEERDPELIAAHRRFLQQGYDKGRFLMSGPHKPPTGGILIARAESLDELHEFMAEEPFCKAQVMRFSKIVEFEPVQHQPVLSAWFGKA
jgi:uncharacterized protein YciI